MAIIIGGHREDIFKNFIKGGKLGPSFRHFTYNSKSRDKPIKDDEKLLKDLKKEQIQICSIDPNSKSCQSVSTHLEDALSSPKGEPLLLTKPSKLNIVKLRTGSPVILETYDTNCQCIETFEDVRNKIKNENCIDTSLNKNKEGILAYMTSIVNDYEEKNNTEIKTDKQISKDNIINKTAKLLDVDCTTEQCVLASVVQENAINSGNNKLLIECKKGLKPEGPRNSNEWLSNSNIDSIMKMISSEYPEFFWFGTTMADFEDSKAGDKYIGITGNKSLGNSTKNITKLIEEGYTCFGCVVNTDNTKSCKDGKCGTHWVCVFIDCRKLDGVPWTIEYFDSVGDPPSESFIKWQEGIGEVLENYRNNKLKQTGGIETVSNLVQHQFKNNECGVYCSYYIRARVEGIPASRFEMSKIVDDVMVGYRRNVFSELFS